jgi:hypothetical protein
METEGNNMNLSKSRGSFAKSAFFWSVSALVLELAVQWMLKHGWQSSEMRFLSLLPLVPMMFFIIALARTILRLDEMRQRICLESIAIAFLLTLALTLVFIGLDRAQIYKARWDDLGTDMMFFWACAYIFSIWRYGRTRVRTNLSS